ncbi:hypothetical protein [Rhizobium phage RHEph15]|uniref:Uncharacterized protein n=2 Tax=Tepoztlanvirus TaxID=3424906 RepID=A0A7S5R5H0_9CAUD|nr:hypothetical protein EVB35_043 [Rhizobium phage RHph_TM34]QIG68320.1 hypothetical protein EVB57_043 [Rhizobium phage RHph_Y1_20]QIG69989.1 hypothetical protein EVB84_045 [Rhizobium phage RHph_Y48]QIG70041.1 hypothetical protein EVB85_045 [Rhizobium phage RHph_Y86]QIG70093.1 hypothetical protein EVB86_045 [Rhizobium phage RHph_Y2_7]QXV74304.1 hypothetical protein [Rhizobium phage RHEph15]QXV74998.1 hypothetical protein [Rhizobium phage RHEph27]
MKETIDSLLSYTVGAGFLFYSHLLANADAILTLGGMVLLGCRLYVDGGKAVKTWRLNRGRSDRR